MTKARYDQVQTFTGNCAYVSTVKSEVQKGVWVASVFGHRKIPNIGDRVLCTSVFIIQEIPDLKLFKVRSKDQGTTIGKSPTLAFAKRICASEFERVHG